MKIKNTLHDFKHGNIAGITLDIDQSFILWRYGGGGHDFSFSYCSLNKSLFVAWFL